MSYFMSYLRRKPCPKCLSMEDKLKNIKPPKKKQGQTKQEYCKEHYGKGYPYIDRELDRLNGNKRCGICGDLKPNTLEFFHKNSQTKDGLHYNCKVCRNGAKRVYYEQRFKSKKLAVN